jgi:tape measure domain-containing protein
MADDRQLLIKFILQDQTKRGFDSVNNKVKNTQKSLFSLKNAFLAVAGSVVVKQALDLANSFQQIQNRLKLVTSSTGELIGVQNQLFNIAQKTRGAFAETVTLYQKLALNSRDLGLNQQQLLEITENVNKAIAISGADSIQASAGILQLSQAFASGRLQGDEFRSISENIPVILDLLAESTGRTRGELKKMASDGLLTADVLAKAIGGATQQLSEDFGKLSPTIGQASTVAGNSLLNFVGTLFNASGASTALSNALIGVSTVLDSLTSLLNMFFSEQNAVNESIDGARTAYEEYQKVLADGTATNEAIQNAKELATQSNNNAIAVLEETLAIRERTLAQLEFSKIQFGGREIELEKTQAQINAIEEYTKKTIELTNQLANLQKQQEESGLTTTEDEGGVSVDYSKQIKELEKLINANESTMQSIFDANVKYGKDELELLKMKQDEELSSINEQKESIQELIKLKEQDKNGIIAEEHEKYKQMLQDLHGFELSAELRHGEELKELDRKLAEERLKIQKQNFDEQLRIFKDGKFAQLDFNKIAEGDMGKFTKETALETLDALAKNNKKAFELNKAYKTAEAIMNTAQGVSKAIASGNWLMAGIIGAMGYAQVQIIQSQQYQGRALGGRVQAGSTYMVGEGGKPEMFIPDQSGTIIPNKDLGRATNVNITINANDTQGFDDLLIRRRSVIVNVINDALNSQGKEALI